jgi:hypothetical protein
MIHVMCLAPVEHLTKSTEIKLRADQSEAGFYAVYPPRLPDEAWHRDPWSDFDAPRSNTLLVRHFNVLITRQSFERARSKCPITALHFGLMGYSPVTASTDMISLVGLSQDLTILVLESSPKYRFSVFRCTTSKGRMRTCIARSSPT